MTASEFMAIAPMFASEDVTRPSLHEPFRCGDRLFATDGRIALAHRARFTELCRIAETTDEKRLGLGKSIVGMIESNDAKIASGKYQGFGLCSMMEAAIAAFANVEPQMMWLRANEPDEDDPDADGSPDSVRHVHESFTCVIMANPARSVIAGYYASLIAGLMKYHGPVEAYADASDPNAMLYFRGPDWNCSLMPLMVCSKGPSWEWNCFGGCSIADAWTGSIVYGRDEGGQPGHGRASQGFVEMRKLKRDKCVVLPLVLKRKWYDMIECGEKKIEYRRASYWLDRVYKWFRRCVDSDGRLVPVVEFRHGYAKDARRMAFVCGWLWNSRERRFTYCTPPYAWLNRNWPIQHPELGETKIERVAILIGERIKLEGGK